jgi:hypothetical protein
MNVGKKHIVRASAFNPNRLETTLAQNAEIIIHTYTVLLIFPSNVHGEHYHNHMYLEW